MPSYTAIRQISVPAPIQVCWSYLTDRNLISQWFADVNGDIQPGAEYEFHFGDGDFFRACTEVMEEPVHLGLWWRFMGAGAKSRIDFYLLDHNGTDISVIDRGDYSRSAALELRTGWDDFLGRLDRAIRTGTITRYRWSESIATGAVTGAPLDLVLALLSQVEWWQTAFPESSIQIHPLTSGIGLTFADPAWGEVYTQAEITLGKRPEGTGISVSHTGWEGLAEGIKFDQRKRYAGLWAVVLTTMEPSLSYAK